MSIRRMGHGKRWKSSGCSSPFVICQLLANHGKAMVIEPLQHYLFMILTKVVIGGSQS